MSERWFPDEMPAPAASPETVEWWSAAAGHRLVVQRCGSCDRTRHPPAPLCPWCRSTHARWEELPGTGTVYTYTVVHQAFIPALADRLPYVVVAVDLDGGDGTRLVSNLVDTDPAALEIGMPVEVVWEEMGPDLALPRVRRRENHPDHTKSQGEEMDGREAHGKSPEQREPEERGVVT